MRRRFANPLKKRMIVSCGGIFWVLCLLSGCTAPASDVQSLEQRALQYMEARQRRDWGRVYDEFLDPVGRDGLERQEFLRSRGRGFDILGYKVVSSRREERDDLLHGKVRMQIDAMIPLLAPGGATKTIRRDLEDLQGWIFRDEQWFVRLQR
ncbi:MAG: hypothetical protein VCC00_01210 [Deltaproteobacteria bacterium]